MHLESLITFCFPHPAFALILSLVNLLPFDHLPAHTPRRLVPARVDRGDWSQIAPLLDRLETAAEHCRTAAELERWLRDWGDLSAARVAHSWRRYIARHC